MHTFLVLAHKPETHMHRLCHKDVITRVLSAPLLPSLIYIRTCTRHASSLSLSPSAAAGLIRRIRKNSFAHITDKTELARVAESSTRDFLLLGSSNQKSLINALDIIGQIKLCRKSKQFHRIAEIWPLIQQLAVLPAKDEHTSRALIGSVLSSVLEAKDAATASSVWGFLHTNPQLPLDETHVLQLLLALRGRPDLVVDVVTALEQGSLGVRAESKYFNAAIQTLVDTPDAAKRVFELASKCNMVVSHPVFRKI
jgi:hypothetical protein